MNASIVVHEQLPILNDAVRFEKTMSLAEIEITNNNILIQPFLIEIDYFLSKYFWRIE